MTIDPASLPSRFQSQMQNEPTTISKILENCFQTLKHLEEIVDKYESVDEQPDPSKPRLKRWSTGFIKNYKKIAWTTEAGDLGTLRSQLMIHTNSLHLVLGVIVSSRTSRIEDSLKGHSDMLREIHSWWAQNLKDVAAAPRSKPIETNQPGNSEMSTVLEPNPIVFAVYMLIDGVGQLLCDRACLHEAWKATESTQLFLCRCREVETLRRAPEHPKVESIALSPLCFPFRQAGDEMSWILFKAMDRSSNRLVSVIIKGVAADAVLEFQNSFVWTLAKARAAAMLQGGMSNMLTHLSLISQSIRLLSLQSDLKNLNRLIDQVTFRVGHRALSKNSVEGLSLLNYRELSHYNNCYLESSVDHAEFSIHYNQATGQTTDLTKTVILTAKKLYQRLEDMRKELLVLGLQSPRANETIVLHLQSTEVQSEVVVIPDAELWITRNPQDQHRLIAVSRNRCTVLAQNLAPGFFIPDEARTPDFASPAWLVQVEGKGHRRVTYRPKGFKFLNFGDKDGEVLSSYMRARASIDVEMVE
ncbi:hypothetical protein N656DRAFT_821227 [Canariomyces notabilis]|uniref:Uncharacterized protein n=1 Tax=Canariomyces notabilis TaxID=2074819 RepID=A0AAN6THI5_9PEZI|nr:hypothetical protein N656DRAFT_821227 [Canariomyces arenarius]